MIKFFKGRWGKSCIVIVSFIFCIASGRFVHAASGGEVYALMDGGDTKSVFDHYAALPSVSGLAVRTSWAAVETQDNVYSWTQIDTAIASANAQGKRVTLHILASQYVAPPTWLVGQGAQTYTYGTGNSKTDIIPWDPIFESKFSEFLVALAAHLTTNGTMSTVRYVSLSAPVPEMSLVSIVNGKFGSSAVAYDRTRYLNAWKFFVDAYAHAFPSTTKLICAPVQTIAAPDQDGVTFYTDVMTYALAKQDEGFAFYATDLTAQGSQRLDQVSSLLTLAPVGFQTIWSSTNDTSNRMIGTLLEAVRSAFKLKAAYFEIYKLDLDSADSTILQAISVISNPTPTVRGASLTVPYNSSENAINLNAEQRGAFILTYEIVTLPSHGTLQQADSKNPACVYTPQVGYVGSDSFSFRVTDGNFVSANATLVITITAAPMVAPTILTHPTDQSVTVGQTASFSVVASGSATLTYQWQKNGVDILGANSASYTTPATVLVDSGTTYRCIVTNIAGSATSNSATLTVLSILVTPTITSQPTASPNPATVDQVVTFSIAAFDSNGSALSYLYNYGDGSSGSSATHVYTIAGIYSATITVTNALGLSVVSNTLTVTVDASGSGGGGGGGSGGGSGGSGSGGGGGGTTPSVAIPMTVSKVSGAVKTKVGHDAISLTGIIPLSTSFTPTGATLTLNIGGVKESFVLDKRGNGKSAHGKVGLKLKFKRDSKTKIASFVGGNVPIKIQLRNGAWLDTWVSAGLDITQATSTFAMPITVTLNGQDYTASVVTKYKGKAAVGGTIKR